MTNQSARNLVALVGSRIAHDLISPLGAIGNGLELMGLSGFDDSPELALIRESVDNANARIRLFRIAFGAAAAGQTVAESEIRALLAPGVDGRKLTIDWRPTGDVPRGMAKLACLALMCLETAMPWGGQVTVAAEGDTWRLAGRAERLKPEPALWALLSAPYPATEVIPARVHFALIGPEAQAQGRDLEVALSDRAISIAF